ncbi:MAG: hypothetical protein AVDCRST_MAG02-1713, partial [uncultured Rubrobacteraceae bacterium]
GQENASDERCRRGARDRRGAGDPLGYPQFLRHAADSGPNLGGVGGL